MTPNLIIPAGDAKIGSTDYFIYSNSMIENPDDINNVPVKIGADQAPVFVGDVGKARRRAQIQQNMVRINGQRSVYVPVMKQGNASTIAVVDGAKKAVESIPGLPKGMVVKSIFGQDTYIRAAIASLEHEAASGAVLASLMILMFLGSFRSTVAIFLSIPLSILAAAFALRMSGATINIMTLGGFALAIGRLVDDSTVVLENINRHLATGKSPTDAARDGAKEVALAVLASTVTTIIVFSPVMFLFGVAKSLFSALSWAVVLSMLASYAVSMTVIPIYCARFLNKEEAIEAEEGTGRGPLAAFIRAYDRFAERYEHLLNRALNRKSLVIGSATALFAISLAMFPLLGTELFPKTDAGQFIIQFRAPLGTRIELTEQLCERMENLVQLGDSVVGSFHDCLQHRTCAGVLFDLFAQLRQRLGLRDGGVEVRSQSLDLGLREEAQRASAREDSRASHVLFVGQHHRLGSQLRSRGADRYSSERGGLSDAVRCSATDQSAHPQSQASRRRVYPRGIQLSHSADQRRPRQSRSAGTHSA